MSTQPERRALISIGTNSTRLLILAGDAIVLARSVGTRLGRGLDGAGKLEPIAAEATLATIRDYAADVRQQAATVDVIATSALRRADDAATFARAVAAIVGCEPRVISGDEEAAYSFRGATWGTVGTASIAVLDVGGGSTELAVGTGARVERTISLEIGAVRLSERVPELLGAHALDTADRAATIERARSAAAAVLAPLADFAGFAELIGVGGTVFTAAAMIARDAARDGVPLARAQRRGLIDELLARDLEGRRTLAHIRPQRADILPAGLIVVDVACALLGIDTLRVSHADLLAGYLRAPEYRGFRLAERLPPI